ncbi:hypothetical protein TRVA0_056S00276 [Trichomonascus vanleenenianus]|uniref:uncharacterized protein n=1 Tax=Trichomonascus vanleenenianus TaxID=2268995 RepID=UPI003ECA1A29
MSKVEREIKHEVMHVECDSGPLIQVPRDHVEQAILEHQWAPQWLQSFHRLRDKLHLDCFLAEAAGSFIFLYFLLMSLGGFMVTDGAEGSYGWAVYVLGIAVVLALYIIVPISGGHISPALTLNAVLFRKFPLKKAAINVAGQLFGTIIATILAFAIVETQFNVNGAIPRPAGAANIYVPVFNPKAPIGIAIMNELVGDTVFAFILTAITDLRNPHIDPKFIPVLVGLALFICANAFGWCYWVLSPIRDIIPRAYISQKYSGLYDDGYWCVTMCVPFLGNTLGVLVYEVFFAKVYKPESAQSSQSSQVEVIESV